MISQGLKNNSGSSISRTFSSTNKIVSSVANATTSPRAIWAGAGSQLSADTGLGASTQFFNTRVKTDIAGGNWLALAPVYAGAYIYGFKSPIGTEITAPVTLSFSFELANGALQNSYLSTNAGSTAPFQGTFNGNVDGVLLPGDILVGDWIYPSNVGLSVFNFSDRTLLPWIRTAWSKTGASDILGVRDVLTTEYNYPSNSHFATCDSYALAKTLNGITGITNYNTTNNFYASGASSTLPSPIGWIGIPASGQKAIIAMGTSIRDGDGAAGYRNGGVNPANNSMNNYDTIGWPSRFGNKLSRSVPVLNFGVGASSMYGRFNSAAAAGSWAPSYAAYCNQRLALAKYCSWFDLLIADDVNNEPGGFTDTLYDFTRIIKEPNPALKIYGVREPNGGVTITGSTVGYSGSLDTRWANEDDMVTNGYWDGMMTNVEDVNKYFLDAGAQVSSTTTSNGSTTTLIDNTQTWLRNQWSGSWVMIGGIKKSISGNDVNTLTFSAYAGAVNSGTAYTIEGNTTSDQLHPNTYGQWRFADNFVAQLASKGISIPYFSRTQS